MTKNYDQADTLRRLMRERSQFDSNQTEKQGPGPRVVTVASGKGGVGKSCLVANLGALLARQGMKVLLIDGDTGLANLDILLGLPQEHRATLEAVLDGRARIQDAIIGVEPNLWLIPASSGLNDLRQSGPETRMRLAEILEEFPWEMDVILIDAGAGIGQSVLSLHSPAYESLVVLTPEPTSLTDGYSLIKLLRRHVGVSSVNIVVNQVTDGRQGTQVFQKLKEVAARFIDVELEYLGHWSRDEKITTSVMKRKILLDLNEGASSVPCLELLAKRLSAKWQENQAHTAGARQAPSHWSPLKTGTGRFQDETPHEMRKAPGNSAKFWRTLLGEVKT